MRIKDAEGMRINAFPDPDHLPWVLLRNLYLTRQNHLALKLFRIRNQSLTTIAGTTDQWMVARTSWCLCMPATRALKSCDGLQSSPSTGRSPPAQPHFSRCSSWWQHFRKARRYQQYLDCSQTSWPPRTLISSGWRRSSQRTCSVVSNLLDDYMQNLDLIFFVYI